MPSWEKKAEASHHGHKFALCVICPKNLSLVLKSIHLALRVPMHYFVFIFICCFARKSAQCDICNFREINFGWALFDARPLSQGPSSDAFRNKAKNS